jgi:hypothetical protein
MTPGDRPQVRTYGGWRQQRGIGLWGLSPAGTLTALLAVLALVLLAAVDVTVLAYAAPPIMAAAGFGLVRIGGEPLAARSARRLRWWHAARRGYTTYRADAVSEIAPSLPGVLAPMALLSADDGFGRRYGIVWDRRTGFLTSTLRVVPISTWLASRTDADSWVAGWGNWLASLGHQPMVRWVTVVVDTAPEPGSALAEAIAAASDPASPAAARQIMWQLAATAPAATADVDTRVSLTLDPQAASPRPRSLTDAVAEAGVAVARLEPSLGSCGVVVSGRLTAVEIAGIVRTGFDPAARGEVARALAVPGTGDLSWAEAGPVGARERPGHYEHDSGISATWAWRDAPRQLVTADVLARLVAPGPYPKRVTLQYRPLAAAEATRVLETEVNAASFRAQYRRRTGRDETARDAHDQVSARQAAAEEAAGAGVCRMSLYVTVTVERFEDLPRAAAWVAAAADSSKIRLRGMAWSQAAGFATGLPCGICPPELARRVRH